MIFEVFVCMLLIATVVPVTRGAANWTEVQKLVAVDGAEGNSFGSSVSVDGGTTLIGAAGSVYVFIRNGTTWVQQAKLQHNYSDGDAGWSFGYTVSLSGDTALIGAYFIKAAYVYIRVGTTWTQQAKLVTPVPSKNDNFGWTVALDGDTALIAAGNKNVYVFTRTGTTWAQQAELTASDARGDFGSSVSLSGDSALIGDEYNNSAYVFTCTGTTWTQQQKLLENRGSFGYSVSINGDTALIGAQGDDCAYVFTRTGTTWTQQAQLISLDSDRKLYDRFGYSVALSGSTAFIGAMAKNNARGSAYIFTRTGTTWTQQQNLLPSDSAEMDQFGNAVAFSGNTAFIGANSKAQGKGAVYVFTISGETEQNKLPVADFTWTPSTPNINQSITFDASTSNDPDGSLTLYEWDWNNDGTYEDSHTTPTAVHSWTQASNYPVTVRITDNGGATNTKTIIIPISSGGGNSNTNNKGTPGFELIFAIGAIAISLMLWKKKKNV